MAENKTKQSEEFKKTAKDLDCDESSNALDRIFGKLKLRQKPDDKKKKTK